MFNSDGNRKFSDFIAPILLTVLVCAVFITVNGSTNSGNIVKAEEKNNVNNVNNTEFINTNNQVDFKKGIITSIYDKDYVCWQADVYFPELNETYPVVLPDSVLDDIYVGWDGYFSFRRYVRTPDWVGLNFNINVYNAKMNSLS